MAKIANFCVQQRVDVSQEKVAQAGVEVALKAGGFEFKREYSLGPKDKPDFMIIQDGYNIVVEMKTRAQRIKIFKQIERYTTHDSVDGVILLSGTAMGLPESINGKPALFASLGRGWLR
ncbi:hypothetical protein HBO38_35065 [Pseudomonas veronii]|uniref:VRR-NUC domain-containing protein n=1 Tax=Pseudomonas veronii TaxID=76761 RepID=A0A7Y1AD34_PSEVE|nr:hypothetical protein [Pseudomonas veronii]NMY13547.1 hypothetical protein [Pseudomonas veronii]